MRLVLYNPHIDDFFYEPVHYRLFGRKPLRKYGNIIREMDNVEVYVDFTESGIIPYVVFRWMPFILRKILLKCEIHIWKKLNPEVRFIYDIKPTDILLIMSYKTCHHISSERLVAISRYSKVIVHLSHYFVNTSKKAENIQKIEGVILAGDSDISQNDYFQHFFSWYDKPILILPFAVATRWKKVGLVTLDKDFIATGTVHDLSTERPRKYYRDYMSFTGLNNYHPRREEAKKFFLEKDWTCYVNEYRAGSWGFIGGLLNRLVISQKAYFRVDLVSEFSRHRFAIIGEERTGFPPLGVFEAMACGCVVIIDPSKYNGLNLIPGENCLGMGVNIQESVKLALSLSDDDFIRISNNAETEAREWWNVSSIASRWNSSLQKLITY
jgi:hypothetical protein